MVEQFNRKLILETGEEYYGYGFGADTSRVFEIVFNTSMVGYQEIISDPSCANQGVVMGYPLIGNYGIADDDYESRTLSIGALIVREYNDRPSNFRYTKTLGEVLEEAGIPGIFGLDTRKLTRTIRDGHVQRAMIAGMDVSAEEGARLIAETPLPRDAVEQVSCRKPWHSRIAHHKYNVVALDCGVKLSTIHSLNARGCNVTVVPCSTSAEAILQLKPDGVIISNGPGSPEDVPEIAEVVRQLRGKVPMFGIGLGHQLIAMSAGAKLLRLPVGHHGCNHPVKCLTDGTLEVYNQNHSYAVDPASLEGSGLTVTHVNLTDHSVEGLECAADHVFSAQFQPNDAEGPRGRICLFDKFVNMMKEAKTHA